MKYLTCHTLLLLLSLIVSPLSYTADYYLAVDGQDDSALADGSIDKPYQTSAFLLAQQTVAPGDNIYLKAGRYNKVMLIDSLDGNENSPITISPAPGAKVILDGTDELISSEGNGWQLVTEEGDSTSAGSLIQSAQWQLLKDNGTSDAIYSMKLSQPIYALTHNNKLMNDARWPNSGWDEPWRLDRYMVLRRATKESSKGTLFDGLPTKGTLEESEKWLNYDRSLVNHRGVMLADTGLSFTNNVVVMSHKWGSWATKITSHNAGKNNFNYDTTFTGSGSLSGEIEKYINKTVPWGNKKMDRSNHSGVHYFLMGLAALDIKNEWWYHQNSNMLYFISPTGLAPEVGSIRGKRRDYQVEVSNSSYVIVKGFEYYGSSAKFIDVSHSTLADSQFLFSASQKFSVDNFDIPVTTEFTHTTKKNDKHYNRIENCSFSYLDGNAIVTKSDAIELDNILIYRTQQTTLGLDSRSMSISNPALLRRVTINDVGASVGIKGGPDDGIYELNNIAEFGGLQFDGAGLQTGGKGQVIYRYNWSHDHPKGGMRFDAGSYPDYVNSFGEMSYNVTWNSGTYNVKGNDHLVHNNLSMDSGIVAFNMARWASTNDRTLVANNAVQYINAGGYDWKSDDIPSDYWLAEAVVSKEEQDWEGFGKGVVLDEGQDIPIDAKDSPILAIRKNNTWGDPTSLLMDPANFDFRPKKDSALIDAGYNITANDVAWKNTAIEGSNNVIGAGVDIGPYEFGDINYWIPGYQFKHASTPIPKDRADQMPLNRDLMYLIGYGGEKAQIFFGSSATDMNLVATQDDPNNIVNLEKEGVNLLTGTTYYWRVDTVRTVNNVLETTQGPVWQFTTKGEAATPEPEPTEPGSENETSGGSSLYYLLWLTYIYRLSRIKRKT